MKLVRDQWFLLVLCLALVAGYFLAPWCVALSNADWLKWAIVTVTMFVMAWPLEFERLQRTFRRPLGPSLAAALNLGLIPVLAWLLAPILGSELGGGLIVAAAAPCTLASAAVWTRRAGGDDSVAIMVTIMTNSVCFLLTPFWVFVLTGNQIELADLISTIYKLLFFVVLPMAVAQACRLNRASAGWATKNKSLLSVLAMLGILTMVFLGAIRTGLKIESGQMSGFGVREIGAMLIFVTAIHTGVLFLGMWLAERLGLPRDEQIAIGFSASQKTLMVGLSSAISLGLSIVPMVAYHAIQLIVDTLIADRLRRPKRD